MNISRSFRSHAPAFFGALIVLLGGSLLTWANMDVGQSRLIPYSGVLQENGADVDGTFALRFALFTTESADATCLLAAGSPTCSLWSEEQTNVTVHEGRFGVTLGANSSITDAHLATSPLYLAVAVRGPADAGFALLTNKHELLSVPFAARAAAAKNYEITGTLTVGGTLTAGATTLNGTADASLAGGGILQVRNPVSGANIVVDANEIMARSGAGEAAPLFLNYEGGQVQAGGSVAVTGGNLAVTNGNVTASGVVNAGGDVITSGRMRLAGDVEGVTSGPDAAPEVYQLAAGFSCNRGDVFIARATGAGNQDSLCVCLLVDDVVGGWCFNP